jgi:hypothetical protein
VYLVVNSAAGFKDGVRRTDQPGWLTILAEPRGDTWKTTIPSLDGRPQYVQDFARRLTPITLGHWRARPRLD